jgi:hypothetical protein
MEIATQQTDLQDPTSNGTIRRRMWADIRADLEKPIPARHISTKKQGGAQIRFCPWHRTQKILDHYTSGHWEWHLTLETAVEGMLIARGTLTIHAADGSYSRQATGNESTAGQDKMYGDPASNAEAQAFKRACARFGLGLHLYDE